MTLFAKDGTAKLVPECTYPLTGVHCVTRVFTDYGVFQITPDEVLVSETYGISFAELATRVDVTLSMGETLPG
jgi:3-oxoadipate CoA-transferase beta subunit